MISDFCDNFALKENVLGKTSNLNAGAGGVGLGEILSIDTVDGSKIVHVLDENGGLNDLGHVRACGFEQCGEVFENLMCLSLKAFDYCACFGNKAALT